MANIAKQIKGSELFKISMAQLQDDRLSDNIMYQKMIGRLEAFYILAEKYRKQGPTPKQLAVMQESGYPFSYRVELHRCLKQLLLNVVAQSDRKI